MFILWINMPQKTFNRPQKPILKLFTALALCFFLIFLIRNNCQTENDTVVEYNTVSSTEIQSVPVEAGLAHIGNLVISISATGISRAVQEVSICPDISGRVVTLSVKEGMKVQKGDLILKLDDTWYRLDFEEVNNNLLSAQARFVDQRFNINWHSTSDSGTVQPQSRLWYVDQNEKEFQKVKNLHKNGKIDRISFDRAKLWYEMACSFAKTDRKTHIANRSGLSRALIDFQKAELKLSHTEVHAPFSGILGDQNVYTGQYIPSNHPCFRLVNLSRLMVEVNCLESEIAEIETGQNAIVRFTAFPGETFPGTITAVNPLVSTETNTCRVTVEIENPDLKIKSGMFAFIDLETRIYSNRFLVPREAILIREDRKLLFVIREGVAKWCYVKTGMGNDLYVEILESTLELQPGEPVLTEGHYTLIHDTPVKITKYHKKNDTK